MQRSAIVIPDPRTTPPAGLGRMPASRRALFALLGLIASLVAGISLALLQENPMLFMTAAALVLLLPMLWRRPIVGLYIIVGGAILFETFRLGFPDSLTDNVPFFHNISAIGGPPWLLATPAELLMALTLAIVILKRIAERRKPLEAGPLIWAVSFYSFMVLFGLVRGVGTGGDLNIAFWEVRPQLYLLFTYLLVYNLVQDKGQAKGILWLFLAAVAVKGLIGTARYLGTLQGDLGLVVQVSRYNSILAHEESFFFALFFTALAILFLFRSSRSQAGFGLLVSLPVLIAFLANQRRAGFLVLGIALAVVGLMAYTIVRRWRRPILTLAVVAAILLPLYVVAMGRSTSVPAQPARAIMSLFDPNERDAGSNNYRVLEATNLRYNIGLDPVLGRGYGKQIIHFLPMPSLAGIFELWDIIPHNTILWVWMRLGFIGFVAFWFLVGRSLLEGSLAARHLKNPYLRSLAVLSVAGIVAWVVQGALDMGLADMRANTLSGVFIGLTSRLPLLERRAETNAPRRRPSPRYQRAT